MDHSSLKEDSTGILSESGLLEVLGTVEEVPNDVFAVVKVDHDNIGQVICFRRCLKTLSPSIKAVLMVGDIVSLRLRSRSAFYENDDWFVVEASKAVTVDDDLKRKEPKRVESPEHSRSRLPFRKSWPLENRRYLLNSTGILRIEPTTGKAQIRIEHLFGFSTLDVDSPVVYTLIENKPMDCKQLSQIVNREVHFDAEFGESGWQIQMMWFKDKGLSDTLILPDLISEPVFKRLDALYWGKVVSIPFHDNAIATIGLVPVLITLSALVTEDAVGSYATIDMFLKTGSRVCMKIKRNGGYYLAEKCWQRGKSEYVCDDGEVSWVNIWGSVEVLKEGVLRNERGHLFISDEISNLKVDEGKIFVDGKLVTPTQLGSLVGGKLSYFVSYEKFVTFAWSGEVPSALVLLKERLAVPMGLVDEFRYYDAVVEEFPVPTHAICRIGLVPVLVPLSQLREGNDALKRGDAMSVCVEEVMISDVTCLVSKFVTKCSNESLLVNFTGRIREIPKPVGVIESDDDGLIVYFELCCVKAMKQYGGCDVFSWFQIVDLLLEVGTKVCFTAKSPALLSNSKVTEFGSSVPRSALEVCVDDDIS